jgi:hypothetical protein
MRIVVAVSMAIISLLAAPYGSVRQVAHAASMGPFVAGWGSNLFGQLGTDSCCRGSVLPQPVVGLSDVASISSDERVTVAVLKDGTVWHLGQTSAQPGCPFSCPALQVPGLSNIVQASEGETGGVALKSDGTVWTWHTNSSGLAVIQQVSGLTGITEIRQSWGMIVAVRNNGTVWEWGTPVGGTDPYAGADPRQVSGVSGIVHVSNRDLETVALGSDGTVWQWGYVSNGRTDSWSGPTQVTGLTGGSPVTAVAAGAQFGVALRADGTVWTWGDNNGGQLGDGTVGVGTGSPFAARVWGLSHAMAIAAGASHALAATSGGRVYAWGANDEGQVDAALKASAGCSCIDVPAHVPGITHAAGVAAGDNSSFVFLPSALQYRAPHAPPVCSSPREAARYGTTVGAHPGMIAVGDGTGLAFVADRGSFSPVIGNAECAGQVSAVNVHSGKKLWHTTLDAGIGAVVDDHSTGHVFALSGSEDLLGHGSLAMLNERSGTVLRRLALPGAFRAEVVAPSSHSLWIETYSANSPFTVTRIDTRTGKPGVSFTYTAPANSALSLLLDSHRGWLVLAAPNGVDVRGAATSKLVRHISASVVCGGTLFGLSSEYDRLYSGYSGSSHGGRGVFCGVDLVKGVTVNKVTYGVAQGPQTAVVDDPVHRVVTPIVPDSPVPLIRTDIFDARTVHMVRTLRARIRSAVVNTATGVLYYPAHTRTIVVYTPSRWSVAHTYPTGGDIGSLALAQDANMLLVTDVTHDVVTRIHLQK